jgi:SAM-dependent methyltransferase
MEAIMTTDRTAAASGQIARRAADVYEEFFVPALFGEWGPRIVEAARIRSGDLVLDVACGTGAAARAAVARGGRVTGLDCNDGMLEVARRVAPQICWQAGRAEALPFADRSFDAALCQFGLMFFEDRVAALAEMWRVLRPGGRLAVAVWPPADASPGYAQMIALINRLFGAEAADALRAPFALGDPKALAALLEAAGIQGATVETSTGTARFPSLDEWVRTDVKGWTLADLIDDSGLADLQAAARRELAHLSAPDGSVVFAAPAHIATACRG